MQLVRKILSFAVAAVVIHLVLDVENLQAKTPVSIELIFAVDTSLSVDGYEYNLMMKGIADAFRKPEIIDLIGHHDGVAVALFQWSSDINEHTMIDWHLLKQPGSILAFANTVETVERAPNAGFTAIGRAVNFGVKKISENAFEGRHLKIDVAGDGRSNFGVPLAIARGNADLSGIVINGLPIITTTDKDASKLVPYYRKKVILGQGAFIEIASDYSDFARAFLRKLQRELNPLVSDESTHPNNVSQKTRVSLQP